MDTPDLPEKTEYPSLALGHAPSSCRDVNIVGLELKVYGLDEVAGSSLPLAVLIATHGRCNNQRQMAHFANGVLGHDREYSAGRKRKRDLIVVTLDQRNHGDRTSDRKANLSYDQNPQHLNDMAACVLGGCQDVSFIIDLLAAYLFPSGERVVEEWIATGISLGGNLTWRLLRTEPRIRIAIPIIGLPFEAFHVYLGARAEAMGIPFEPPTYPPSLKPLLEQPVPAGCYDGKKILSIHGGADSLVPYSQGEEAIRRVQEQVESSGGAMEVWVREDTGHVVTQDMIRRVAEWVWKWALSSEESREGSKL